MEYADGHPNPLSWRPIERGPAWIQTDLYQIEAKAQGAPGQAAMRGPMLRALLEERFKLKVRRESREVAVYALSVAKSGPKLEATKEGSCVPVDYSLPVPYPQFCGRPKRGDPGLHLIGATMTDLCKILSVPEMLGQEVIDKTGIVGMFDVPLPGPGEVRGARDPGVRTSNDSASIPAASDPSASLEAVQTAIQKLGLKIDTAKGLGEFIVIEHVERPSEN